MVFLCLANIRLWILLYVSCIPHHAALVRVYPPSPGIRLKSAFFKDSSYAPATYVTILN